MNGWERAQLVYRLVLLPSDNTLRQIDTLVADFIRAPKGMEANMDQHMLGTLPKEGGMGVQQSYGVYRRRHVTSM